MTEPVIHREEVVGLLFTVNDILVSLQRIEGLPETMKRKMTRAERDAQRAETEKTIAWVREIAERAEAELPADKRRPAGASNSEWLRQLAERGKSELDRKSAAG